jgi:phospholipid/cholesterol/gamma-HCH transport system substrate-binding protein
VGRGFRGDRDRRAAVPGAQGGQHFRVGIQSPYTLSAHFDNIGGLKVRAPVKSAGVLVGRVEEIRYDNERFQAEVVFTVDGRYKFPVDTFANILTSGLLGEQYIGLDPGGEEKNLAPGEVIKRPSRPLCSKS